MRRILDLPLIVILAGIAGTAMFLPAAHAYAVRDLAVARAFLYSGVAVLLLTAMIGVAMAGQRPPDVARRHLTMLAGAYVLLPVILALPFSQAVRDTTFLNAWFEMVSCFTTTGATVYDAPGRLLPSLHLWRGLVGWLGGLFVLISAAAILAPLDLGGAEVMTGRVPGRGAGGADQVARIADPSRRLVRHTLTLAPAYAALTLALWVWLLIAGGEGLAPLMLAMATVSTSGVVAGAGQGLAAAPSGLAGEVLIFFVLLAAVTRRSLPGAVLVDRSRGIRADHEVRLAAFLLVLVPSVLFLRHWLAAGAAIEGDDLGTAGRALWGALFTTLSFLTTTGLESADWQAARAWSGLGTPGLILLGLAMIGGGVATTAGGLKLLRVHALMRHGERELDRLVHPSSVGGGGEAARRMRNEGAYAAWVFFMLFAISLAVGVAVLSLARVSFENALVLTIASLTTTGPLAVHATEQSIRYVELDPVARILCAVLMIVGRVEVLAVLTVLMPSGWRR
ncbi:MAG TPA: potassium transporter TrkG [Paracoccaceae bacterium]|nr:potassium transporter TrkG [Paracoccaceae bacterium]